MFESVSQVAEMPLERLEAELLVMAARSTAAMAAWLVVVEEFDRRRGYESWEVPSTASWLAWKCGVDHRTARDYVRVARALPSLPHINQAFDTGELPYCKVRALTRVATTDSEADLLAMARLMTTAQLERTVRATRPGIDNHHASRPADGGSCEPHSDDHDYDGTYGVDTEYDDHGGCRVRVDARAEHGGLFEAVLGQHHDLLIKDWKAGSREPGAQWDFPTRADAFVALCQAAMSHTNKARGVDDDRYLAIVHLQADGTGYLDDGPRLPPPIIAEITCCRPHRLFIKDHKGNPLYLGRTQREPSRRQRRALAFRARHRCEVPGCGHKRFLHAHHITWWVNGGPTNIDNLVLVCSRHHRLIHQGRLNVQATASATFAWTLPDGTTLTDGHDQPAIHPHTIPQAAVTQPAGGTGERIDLNMAVTGMLCTVLGHPPR